MLQESTSKNSLQDLVVEKIKFGETLIEAIVKLENLDGLTKLQRKIHKELSFLKKLAKTDGIKKEHLQCSNLTHFAALLEAISEAKDCVSVNRVFLLHDRKITVDIVCDNGLTWIKVIARNPKSLSQIFMGNTGYGVRTVMDQAREYIECAQLYPCLFQTPKVVFSFAYGVGTILANTIQSLGIVVLGNRLDDVDIIEETDDDFTDDSKNITQSNSSDLSSPNISHFKKVNLDVSAMLAYVSSVTNGGAHLYDFSVDVLAQQAEWERQRPQKAILDSFFKDKTLYCCQTAKDNFVNIVKTVGGPNEKIRAGDFLKRIFVLPDDASIDDVPDNQEFKNIQFTKDKSLSLGGKIRERSLVIFTFGDRIGAVTVSANDGFVRSAKQQGVNFVVFIHESRALTEQKELAKGTHM